ncbi:MAG: hypothetical protein ACFFD8_11300 [Candidatus Thorarchaeota archaeon]
MRDSTECRNCGEKLLIRLSVEPITSSSMNGSRIPETGTTRAGPDGLGWKFFAKMFLHGVLFVLFFIFFSLAWALVALILVSLGYFIGLILAFGLMFLGIGGFNAVLGVQLWNIESNTGFWSLFFHGLVLFVALLIVGVVASTLPNLFFPGTLTYIITNVGTSFLYGAVGKKVALWFRG